MKIGTDIRLEVCRAQGYTVMEVNKREFNKAPTTTYCDFSWSLPDYVRTEMGWKVGDPIIYKTACENYKGLFELYTADKEGIDSFIGGVFVWSDTPNIYEVLNLGCTLNSYLGLGGE